MTDRKKDHIELALESRINASEIDERFYYEPMLSGHPVDSIPNTEFLGKKMNIPVWVSSMTGGTKLAGTINRNLARACKEFGMGMGLGSCRTLLKSDQHFDDFNMREIIGDGLPLYANLGISQVEQLVLNKETDRITNLASKLRTDGLIVHVNPFQEWFQPEGDRLLQPAVDTLGMLLEEVSIPVIVKEVGQGMGLNSLRALLKLPLAAIEFGAFGGTNFAKVELLRSSETDQELFGPLSKIGHDAFHMVNMINHLVEDENNEIKCRQLIVSGGIKTFLDGYYLINKSSLPAIYGQASTFLKYARGDYEQLRNFVSKQKKGLELAYSFLRLREIV
jgi:isopentenyl-diphosphate delta-isomerase